MFDEEVWTNWTINNSELVLTTLERERIQMASSSDFPRGDSSRPSSGAPIFGPPRPGDVWPRPAPVMVVGDILSPQSCDTHYPCPYCTAKVSQRKYRLHVRKCRKRNPEIELKTCPFNACHEIKVSVFRHFFFRCVLSSPLK